MDVLKAIKGRRSIRRFSDRKVTRDSIIRIIDAAQWAPSACNKQMWKFLVIDDQKSKADIVDKGGAVGFLKNAPVVVLALYDKRITRKRGANLMSASAAIQNMLLAAHDYGIGSVWVNEIGDERYLRKRFGIPGYMLIASAVALGYPGEKLPAPKRRDVMDITYFGSYGGDRKRMSIFPSEWSAADFEDYRRNGIRATSPFPSSHMPGFSKELEAEAGLAMSRIIGKEVLDILPFSGNYTSRILDHTKRKLSIFETSDEVVNFLKKKLGSGGISFRTGGLYKIPYPSSKFDTVLCFKRLETVPEPEKLVSEMSRVTKKGGRLIITFWKTNNIFSANYRMKTSILGKSDVTSNEGPVRPLDASRVRNMLEKNGFSIKYEAGINLAPITIGRLGLEGVIIRGFLMNICRTLLFECVKL